MIRLFDFVISFFGLVILSPLLLVISLIIKVTTRGPVFYKQSRVGISGTTFFIWKFRTMKVNSDQLGLLTVGERDHRITMIGYYLRKYKLDEVPQLINVFLGSMSLVGPRPEVQKYVDQFNADQLKVLSIKPGMTDWSSIKYRNENSILANSVDPEHDYVHLILPDKIEQSLIYVDNRNVYHYFKIICTTIYCILFEHRRK